MQTKGAQDWSDEHVRRFWRFVADDPHLLQQYFSRMAGSNIKEFLKTAGVLQGSILDFGCGPGFLLDQLLAEPIVCAAAEFSSEAVASVNARFTDRPNWRGAHLIADTAFQHLEGSCDLVTCVEVIEHLRDDQLQQTLSGVARLLKPGGFALFTTPNDENLTESLVYCPFCDSRFHRVQHLRSFTVANLSNLLVACGFRVVFCQAIDLEQFCLSSPRRHPCRPHAAIQALIEWYLRTQDRRRKVACSAIFWSPVPISAPSSIVRCRRPRSRAVCPPPRPPRFESMLVMDTTPAHSSQRECWVWFAEEPVLPLGYELLSFKEAVFRVSDSVFHPCRFETLLSALDVPEDLLWQKLSNGKRRDIRIARNRHWRVCSGQSPDDIERFHRLHSLFTETKGLAAPLPLTILQRNSRSCWGSFVHVGDGQVLCWHFYVLDKPLVRLWYSGSNLACSSKADRGYAAALLHWEMMRHFREQGFRTYDWGGASTDPLSPTRSITRFKMDFGGVPAERFDYVCRVRLPYCARAWRHIRGRLAAFRGRLRHALFRSIPSTLCRRIAGVFGHAKPRILLLADKRHWAHDHSARQIVRWLQHDYAFDVRYVRESPKLDPAKYDLVYVFWWGETYHQSFGFDPARVIKGLSSHRWEDDPRFGPCSPVEMVHRYLRGTGAVLCPSLRLFNLLSPVYPRSYHVPKGYDSRLFRLSHRRSGPMTIGWAGNAKDPVKRCQELLLPACGDRFRLVMAGGDLSHRRMSRFYRDVDVFAVTSRHEGDPLTLIEAMAAGCFPVCTDVGIVPELVRSGENGLIVEGTAAGFREAFEWCETHLTEVRAAGERNAMEMKNHRRWELAAQAYGRVFSEILRKLQQPRFRNDDVSWDTDLARFRTFCSVFQKYGHQQVHGITLFGRTSTVFRHGSDPVAYENTPSISALANDRIRELSQNCRFAERRDLVQFLRDSPDEIALHGLFHTDYSTMTYEEQCRDIREGLRLLDELFPRKPVRYFVAPFNRANAATVRACAELDLFVLANEGVHLEAELADLRLRPGVWYRYHHHRFYPETAFSYYRLSLDALDSTLGRHGHAVNRLM